MIDMPPTLLSIQIVSADTKIQRYIYLANILIASGAFDIAEGSVTIHYDSAGCIKKLERKDNLAVLGCS